MTSAIIRHLNSGEHFAANLDDSGNVVRLSVPLPTREATDPDTGEIDWARFDGADVEPFEDSADGEIAAADSARHWTADRIAVVHTF